MDMCKRNQAVSLSSYANIRIERIPMLVRLRKSAHAKVSSAPALLMGRIY